MSRLYLDSSCIIYLVESTAPFHDMVVQRLTRHSKEADATLVTSRLSRLECRTKPLREGDERLLANYEALFSAGRMLVVDLTAEVVERATEIRAQHKLKTPDALHLATAVLNPRPPRQDPGGPLCPGAGNPPDQTSRQVARKPPMRPALISRISAPRRPSARTDATERDTGLPARSRRTDGVAVPPPWGSTLFPSDASRSRFQRSPPPTDPLQTRIANPSLFAYPALGTQG